MRTYALAIAILCLLAPEAGAGTKHKRQPKFTCAGKTQQEMNGCAGDYQQKCEKLLDDAVSAAGQRLADDEQRGKLAAAQRAWSDFRTADCELRTWPSHDGSIHGMELQLCLAGMALERVTALEQLPLAP
jgi:uncharacterized protein YecT (DUF1311 family)